MDRMLICHQMPAKRSCSQAEVDHLFLFIVLPNTVLLNMLYLCMYGASESELTIAQQSLDRCFKCRYKIIQEISGRIT